MLKHINQFSKYAHFLIDFTDFTQSCFGFVVVISGVWRIVSAEGGSTGLWFGLTMGCLAWLSALLFWNGKSAPAYAIGVSCIALVGGWFGYESFVKKGFANSEVRQLIVIGCSFMVAMLLAWFGFVSNSSREGSGNA